METVNKNRRELVFENWDEVLDDLSRLELGYTAHGTWDLSQTSRHLCDWVTFPVQGFAKAPLFIRCSMWILRNTIGPGMLRKIISEKRMADGGPTDPKTVYAKEEQSDEADRRELEKLRAAIAQFRAHEGAIHTSPVFGPMNKETAEALQFVHFAHHLSWLEPKASS